MKFSEFNREINPNDENVYIVESKGARQSKLSLTEVKRITGKDADAMIKMLLPKGFMIIKTKEQKVLSIITSNQEPVMVVDNNGELNIWCKGKLNANTINNVLACGIDAEVIAQKGAEVIVPFINKQITNVPYYLQTNVIYGDTIGNCPNWLTPLQKKSAPTPQGLQIPIVNNAQLILQKHLQKLAGFNKFDQQDIINLINNNFVANKLTQDEVDNILDIISTQLIDQFTDKGQLMHWKLGDYVIQACNIKRNAITKELYFYDQKKNIYTNDEDYLIGYLTKLIPQLKDYQKQETSKYIYNYLYDDSVKFNTNEYTVVFKNGIFDISNWHFEPMTPDHLESIQLAIDYNPTAVSPTADEFFATATCGDKDVEQLLYEAIGYCLLKTNALAKSFILTGIGRNGKSTFLDIVKRIVGEDNYAAVSFKDLGSNFRVSQLKNKLASCAGDISSQPIQESDLFKSISAFEDITLEEKYKQSYTAKLFSTMLFACNKIPRTPDTSQGFYRRMVIVPFNADLSKVSSVDGLLFAKKLLSQESLSYIAYKALKAIHNVLNTTYEFTQPQCVIDMLNQYKIDNSTTLSWFYERYKGDVNKIKDIPLNKAYGNYTAWCSESGRLPSSKTTFGTSVKTEIGITLKES